jgi:hypothetical protein
MRAIARILARAGAVAFADDGWMTRCRQHLGVKTDTGDVGGQMIGRFPAIGIEGGIGGDRLDAQ